MRKINLIVLHCSATRETMEYTPEQLERDHKARGFFSAGYNYYIRRSGEVVPMRRRSRFRHMRKGIMRSAWGFVTKVGWMPTGIRKIRVRRGKNCLSGDCCCCCWCGIRDVGSAGTVICRPTGMAMGRSRGMNG